MAGFIKTNFDIKLIVLYVLSKFPEPMAFDDLAQVAICDEGVNYFLLKQSVEELEVPENVILTQGLYSITERGKENLESLRHDLPVSIQKHCDEELLILQRQKKFQNHLRCEVEENIDGTCLLDLGLSDSKGVLMELKLISPNREEADLVASKFHGEPSGFFQQILSAVRGIAHPDEGNSSHH